MRLSATERIIREAEEAEARSAASRPRAHDDDLVGHDDDTQVSYVRSAEALEKLRSFELPSPRPTAGRAAPSVAPISEPPRRRPGGLPQGRPKIATDIIPIDVAAPEPLEPPLVLEAPSSRSLSLPRRTVGRRVGIVIAAATAGAVVLVVGAWTAHSTRLATVSAAIAPAVIEPPSRSASTPILMVAPIIEPTPTPATLPEPTPPIPPPPAPEAAPPAVAEPPKATEPRVSVSRSRPAHKAAAKAKKRKPHAVKLANAARAARPRAAGAAAGPPGGGGHAPSRSSVHPDDPLPISAD